MDLLGTVRKELGASVRIHMFSRLVGIIGDTTEETSNFFIRGLECLRQATGGAGFVETPDALQWINIEFARQAVISIFDGIYEASDNQLKKIVQDTQSLANTMTRRDRMNTTTMVCVDDVMQLVMKQWDTEYIQTTEFLEALFTAGDVNRDGTLSFEEFSAIVTSVDDNVNTRQLSRMYREALHESQQNGKKGSITAKVFSAVARKHKLSRKKVVPTWQIYRRRKSMAPSGDALMRLLADTWDKTKADIYATLEQFGNPKDLMDRASHVEDLIATGGSTPESAWEAYHILVKSMPSQKI